MACWSLSNPYLFTFLVLFLLRYLRSAVHAIAYWTLPELNVSLGCPYSSFDVTVVLPSTLDNDISQCLLSIRASAPSEIVLVVTKARVTKAESLINQLALEKYVKIVVVSHLSKRQQMVEGLKLVKTAFTIFADDDVRWPSTYISILLMGFNDPSIGAAGTKQSLVRPKIIDMWYVLGAAYLERRNFNTMATNRIDGGVSTLSGRTSCFRTNIIQRDEFYEALTNERFLGASIRIGDDKRITRWLLTHGYKCKLVNSQHAILQTMPTQDWNYLRHCLRWQRSHWQGNAAAIMDSSSRDLLLRKHPWTAYAAYFGSLLTPAAFTDVILWRLLHIGLYTSDWDQVAVMSFWGFTLLQKTVKMWGHFWRYPADLRWLPALIAFSYLHGTIALWSLATMTSSEW